ncbi:MAG TPA: glutamyl-tRNA reductase [Xanthomonadaceae bacterium]|nr:glutamyl-tRNA reductase [Xanthomonadaceae bacterium]
MPLLTLGMNHQSAPLALRERVAIGEGDVHEALRDLKAAPGVGQAALLSTCNRTEIYAEVEAGALSAPARWLARYRGLAPAQVDEYCYLHVDGMAVRHLFRVATGLDSMVLGEPQILGQAKLAHVHAREAGTLGPALDRMFQQAFAVAKRVRTDTRIGANPVSIAFAGVRLAQQVFTELDKASVMLIGAGDTVELAATHLAERRARRLLFANRTLEHAQVLATRFSGYALSLGDLRRHLSEADVVISATASREPILHRDTVAHALIERRRRPMFMLDLAVPRDIAPDVAGLEDLYLYTIDDLEEVIEENRRTRREAADQAEAIVELQAEHFMAWWRASTRQDVLRRLRSDSAAVSDRTLEQARSMLAHGRDPEAVLEYLAHTLTNRLLHSPSARLREAALGGDLDLLNAAERLFALLGEDKDADDADHPPQA